MIRSAAKANISRTRSPSACCSTSSISAILSSVIVISVVGSRSCKPNLFPRSAVTASVTHGRALRYAEGPARGLLHHHQGHCPVAGEPHPYDPGRKTRLHIGHVIDKSMGGSDDATNLRAICHVCDEGAANVTLDRPSVQKFLIQIRRAPNADQVQTMEWLTRKFPDQAKSLILKD